MQRALIVAIVGLSACHDASATWPTGTPDVRDAGVRPRDERADATLDVRDAGVVAPLDAAADARTPEGMLLVPRGTFVMGADEGGEPDERPAHRVTVDSFWLDRTEVTNAAWSACVAARACRPSARASATHAGRDEDFLRPAQPIVGASWDDARGYCAWRGKRLPHEAELERAMRGDDGRRYPWGSEPPTPDRAVFGRAFGRDAPDDVGTHPAGRGPYGHDDLAGNVWEWVEDEYDPIAYTRPTAATGVPGSCTEILAALARLRDDGKRGFTGSNAIPSECEHVLRGGAWNYFAQGLRSTNRVHHPARFRATMAGLRCAK